MDPDAIGQNEIATQPSRERAATIFMTPGTNAKRLFDKFELLDCWKKDEFSAVYLAHHIYLDKNIVLKTLNVAEIADPSSLQRFKQEAKILAQLDHPGVIKILDFGVAEKVFYISFEHFAALSLRAWLTTKPLSREQKISVLYQISQALAAVHRLTIVHRDVKPENILLNHEMIAKLADFGLAQMADAGRLTDKNSVMGTPAYLAPEQIRGEALTPAADVFAFGVVAYELWSGVNPFLGADIGSTINNILSRPEESLWGEPLLIEPALSKILRCCLQRNPGKRYQSAEAVCTDLAAAYPAVQRSAPEVRAAGSTAARLRYLWLLLPMLLISIYFIISSPDSQPGQEPAVVEQKAGSAHKVSADTLRAEPEQGRQTAPEKPQTRDAKILPQNPARLMVYCLPWADVLIDEKKIDTTPMNAAVLLQPGEHVLTLQHPDYPAWHKKVHLGSGESITVQVRLDTLFGFIQPLVHPWGRVLIDSVLKGTTPLAEPVALAPGAHRISVQHPQYAGFAETIFIRPGDTLRYEVDLTRFVQQ
jgi:eukaryotic-like serine/threonine-protein kinase